MDIPVITIEDDHYIYHQDGRIFSKYKGDFLNLRKDKDGYLTFSDVNTSFPRKTRKAHRVIYEKFNGAIPNDKQIDHINNKRDDNRLENLQLLSCQHNIQKKQITKTNTSGYKGVSFKKQLNKFYSTIRFNRKNVHLGTFDNAIDGARAYNNKAIELNLLGHHYTLNDI